MLTFDAFAFIQVTFLMFIFVGLGSVATGAESAATAPEKESVSLRRRPRTSPG